MDRTIINSGQKPRSADLLVFEKAALIGVSYLTQSLLGQTNTMVSGLAASPGTGLTVSLASGAFYELAQVDATAYGSLAADTSDYVLKQGLQLVPAVLSGFTAPVGGGQSINYLIEAQYQDVDTTPVTLMYWNSANPTQYLQGESGNGVAQNTIRSGQIAYQVKAGTAAATGTQITPTADAGWTGLYVVTVSAGQISIPSGQIVSLTGAPFLAGLLNSHHDGNPGQAPPIILGPSWIRGGATGYEVQGILPIGNLPSSDTIGTLSAVQAYVGNPNGALAGNAAIVGVLAPSLAWDPTNGILWACVVTGSASTAVWQRIPRIPSAEYTYINASQSLGTGMYAVDTSAGVVTITLNPAGSSVLGDNYTFLDWADTFSINNLIINPNGATIQRAATNMMCDVSGIMFTLGFASGNWSLQ